MKKGLLKIQWEDIKHYTDEEITYFLFLEGKDYNAISKIRNISKETVQKHIIDGKIKYGFLAKSKNEKELLINISKAGKLDKLDIIKSLDLNMKEKLIQYIKQNYVDMYGKEKETAIWIIGELKDTSCNNILVKASVHKFVNVRRMAVSAMGKIQDIKFEMSLIRALEDENSQVVTYSIKALTKINSQKAYKKIQKIYLDSQKEYIKKAAGIYLDNINLQLDKEEVR
ncbi:helix-turn-helix domain-containing protein [Clostridium rectalis]|uniref:helix-turn-helix domain-containing protein n=1 Tax=Clostridium rectalis TaxID=2040295 RepID=UPI000F642204|nr:helix-turn-helix domain-containing protein [Clostridium rectalis]